MFCNCQIHILARLSFSLMHLQAGERMSACMHDANWDPCMFATQAVDMIEQRGLSASAPPGQCDRWLELSDRQIPGNDSTVWAAH